MDPILLKEYQKKPVPEPFPKLEVPSYKKNKVIASKVFTGMTFDYKRPKADNSDGEDSHELFAADSSDGEFPRERVKNKKLPRILKTDTSDEENPREKVKNTKRPRVRKSVRSLLTWRDH